MLFCVFHLLSSGLVDDPVICSQTGRAILQDSPQHPQCTDFMAKYTLPVCLTDDDAFGGFRGPAFEILKDRSIQW